MCFARKRALGGGEANQAKKQKGLAHFSTFFGAPVLCCAHWLHCRHGKQGSEVARLKSLLDQQKAGKGGAAVLIP